MRKIPTLFLRDPENLSRLLAEVNQAAAWVLAGDGKPTRKFDGTCVMRNEDGSWWARREVKPGKASPANYRPEEIDEVTGKTVGWEPIEQSPFVKAWREAMNSSDPGGVDTYELCGPKINGNPEGFERHVLVRHGETVLHDVPTDFAGLREYLRVFPHEGVVWHHPDGRMAKIKRRDFSYQL